MNKEQAIRAMLDGVWVPRTRKYRYAFKLDKKVEVLYMEAKPPKSSEKVVPFCCGGTFEIEDKRNAIIYACPHCIGGNDALIRMGN